MKNTVLGGIAAIALLGGLGTACTSNTASEPQNNGIGSSAVTIVPEPQSIRQTRTAIRIPADRIRVYAGDRELRSLIGVWAEALRKPYEPGEYQTETGFRRIVSDVTLPKVSRSRSERKAEVKLYLDLSLAEEQYTLSVNPEEMIAIRGGSAKGVWWGLQTLTQILIESAENPRSAEAGAGKGAYLAISGLEIDDYPQFSYRSAHFDCCRHFFSVAEVKKFIDVLALHKLNTFHWHLTDDQGWRIEIKKYPELTKVGAWRAQSPVGWAGQDGKDGTPYGGYYTQKEIREVVKYAAARQIAIIPEIEMPGHAEAALASYNYLGCRGKDYDVWQEWGVNDEVFCIGRESTFEFLENVLDEVCELFPGEYIHIGGDECPRDRWRECPDCQQRMRDEGLTEVGELQGYMLKRIEKYLNAKGKHIIGWDEILDSEITPTATVMSWRGPQGGITAAKRGNKVIMVPNNYFYLDYYQTADPRGNGEPAGIGGHVPIQKCWSFDPYDQLDAEAQKYIIGIQANTWTEYICSLDHAQHMELPRFSALSEVAWHKGEGDAEQFVQRVSDSMRKVYEYYGLIYAPYAFQGIQ